MAWAVEISQRVLWNYSFITLYTYIYRDWKRHGPDGSFLCNIIANDVHLSTCFLVRFFVSMSGAGSINWYRSTTPSRMFTTCGFSAITSTSVDTSISVSLMRSKNAGLSRSLGVMPSPSSHTMSLCGHICESEMDKIWWRQLLKRKPTRMRVRQTIVPSKKNFTTTSRWTHISDNHACIIIPWYPRRIIWTEMGSHFVYGRNSFKIWWSR